MTGPDFDLYLCCRDDGDAAMVSEAAAGFARLGFRVLVAGRDRGARNPEDRVAAIARIPDFVLLSSPRSEVPGDDGEDPRARDVSHAFKTRRNILVLADAAHRDPLVSAEAPGRPPLAAWQVVPYDRGRVRESIALVAHRLVSSSDVEDRRFMRRVKQATAAVALLLAVAIALRAVPAVVKWWNRPTAPEPLPRFTIYWTATGQQVRDGQWQTFPLADGSAVSPGDRLRLTFSTGSDGHAYAVARDAQGGLTLLFPAATVRGASRVRAGTIQHAPAQDRWFTVDAAAGISAIYLVAGHDPLENLEELAEEADDRTRPAERMELLSSTIAGLLDGRHAAVPRPIRSRRGREVVDALEPAPPPRDWPQQADRPGGPSARPLTHTGLLSVVVEIRLRSETRPLVRE